MLRLIRKRDESDRLSAVRKNREINVSFACRSVYGYSFGQKTGLTVVKIRYRKNMIANMRLDLSRCRRSFRYRISAASFYCILY